MERWTEERLSPEVGERAVRMEFDHQGEYFSQWSDMVSISATNRSHRQSAQATTINVISVENSRK